MWDYKVSLIKIHLKKEPKPSTNQFLCRTLLCVFPESQKEHGDIWSHTVPTDKEFQLDFKPPCDPCR